MSAQDVNSAHQREPEPPGAAPKGAEVYSRAPGIRIISITMLVFPFLFKVTKTILALQDK